MAKHRESISIPSRQLQQLDERLEAQPLDPQPGQTWDEVKREIAMARSKLPILLPPAKRHVKKARPLHRATQTVSARFTPRRRRSLPSGG
jgi:hypothetical protein